MTRSCVQHGLYLVEDKGARLALLVHAREHGPFSEVILDVAGPDADQITSTLEEVRRLVSERSVFRGQVIAFGAEMFGFGHQVPVLLCAARLCSPLFATGGAGTLPLRWLVSLALYDLLFRHLIKLDGKITAMQICQRSCARLCF